MTKKKNISFIDGYTKGMEDAIKENSLSSFVNSIAGFNGGWEGAAIFGRGVQASQIDTLAKNNRNYFISNFRYLLSESYVEHGLIQTMIDLPVDDAFRTEIEFKTNELNKKNKRKSKSLSKRKIL